MIVTDDKILRQMSTDWEGTVEELDELVKEMESAMKEVNGIGIAAIQIGVPKRIFITGDPLEIFINPKILELSSMKKKHWEGCLSCPDTEVRTSRARTISIEYTTVRGEEFAVVRRKFTGFDAVRIQHELDHLNGFLIKDRGKVYEAPSTTKS